MATVEAARVPNQELAPLLRIETPGLSPSVLALLDRLPTCPVMTPQQAVANADHQIARRFLVYTSAEDRLAALLHRGTTPEVALRQVKQECVALLQSVRRLPEPPMVFSSDDVAATPAAFGQCLGIDLVEIAPAPQPHLSPVDALVIATLISSDPALASMAGELVARRRPLAADLGRKTAADLALAAAQDIARQAGAGWSRFGFDAEMLHEQLADLLEGTDALWDTFRDDLTGSHDARMTAEQRLVDAEARVSELEALERARHTALSQERRVQALAILSQADRAREVTALRAQLQHAECVIARLSSWPKRLARSLLWPFGRTSI